MKRLAVLVLPLLAACHKEPDFDERYAHAAKTIHDRAEAIDREIAASASASPGPVPASPRAAR